MTAGEFCGEGVAARKDPGVRDGRYARFARRKRRMKRMGEVADRCHSFVHNLRLQGLMIQQRKPVSEFGSKVIIGWPFERATT
jgi:hypothetical protein